MKLFSNLLQNLNKKSKKTHSKLAQGPAGIKQLGHRKYVGGLWQEIGKLQFEFLLNKGLKPTDIFLDIACGSLRAGVHLIPYLQTGNYLGLDKESDLIDLGIKNEIDSKILEQKKPEFVISKNFEFQQFSKTPNYAIAQSLFTHLPSKLINKCMTRLKYNFAKDGVFFATFFITDFYYKNPKEAHDHGTFKYSKKEIQEFGTENGWDVEIIGNWGHPRNQQIVKYTLKN